MSTKRLARLGFDADSSTISEVSYFSLKISGGGIKAGYPQI